MHNMSNRFYSYISTVLTDYFRDVGIKSGDRYYLQLDSEEEVLQLVNALNEINGSKVFRYQHERGEEYLTFSLPFQSVNLVIAFTSKDVKPDFLVTLRNLVGEQKGGGKDTALLSIVSEQLDSIQGGSSDLQKEGMPLHSSSIFSNLKNEIENSVLDKVDQLILLDNLEILMLEQSFQQLTFFEFEDIFTTLQKGSIEDHEYYKFGLFKDPDLDTFKGKDQKDRLKENRELFDFVRKVHDIGFGQEELEKRFTAEGAKVLFDDDWKDNLFTKVHKLKAKPSTKKVDLLEIKISNKLKYWDKPHKESAAGKRKRHIVIFNPDGLEEIEFQASFNLTGDIKSLTGDFIKVPNQFSKWLNVNVKTKNIVVKITTEEKKPTFVRFTYKHDNKVILGAEFLITVLPINPLYLDSYRSKYTVDPDEGIVAIQLEEDLLVFGDGFDKRQLEITEDNQYIIISEEERVTITPLPEAYNDDDELKINLEFDQVVVPILIKNELQESMPITGFRIWKLIRETGKDIQWVRENNRLILENREFYFHSEYREFFEWEEQWIEHGLKFARLESDQLLAEDIKLTDELREAYNRYLNYFKPRNSIPSLCVVNEDLKKRALEYILEYQNEIKKFETGIAAGSKGIDLFKLGTIHANGVFYFTPFHPLMVAFKLKTYELLDSEEIDNSILNRLNPDALVPFLYNEKTLYKPDHQQAAMEWLTFKPVSKISVSDANQYLAKVVNDKISQFKEHFSYLFIQKSQAPLQINIINITNDLEVIRGIFQWMLKEIDKSGIENLKPIEVTLYKEENIESSFDLYARTETVKEFEETFDINLNIKKKELESEDILRVIREKLFFYKQEPNNNYRYAHISFYKMHAQETYAVQPIKDMTSGIALEGLYSSVPSMRDQENYKSGFGTKAYSLDEKDYLANTAYLLNELAANLRNGGYDSYRKGEAIFSRTTNADEDTLEKIFKSSYWVTFVDPSMDLEFFNKYDGNLVVIHYSDQYSSSSRFDAITVTDKSDQYYSVIKEFLKQKEVEGTDDNVLKTIKAFNTFNGEWLLRIIGSKGHYDREKLSIISAIKYAVSYFDHANILWVPISLEEILRVAGAVSLNKSEGVFTAKNLGVKGSHSDDLLLIGLENYNNKLALHFYPIEVKIGINSNDVLDKARNQVEKTKALFINTLSGEGAQSFAGKFYRNFFAQLFIANAKKLSQSEFWSEKEYNLSDDIIEKLLKNDFEVANILKSFIGDGAILSFQKNTLYRSARLDDKVLLLNLTEVDGYHGLIIPIKEMRDWIQNEPNDFIKEDMLSYKYKAGTVSNHPDNTDDFHTQTGENTEHYQSKTDEDQSEAYSNEEQKSLGFGDEQKQWKEDTHESSNATNSEVTMKENTNVDEVVEKIYFEDEEVKQAAYVPNLEDLRIKIGKAANSNREIFWEYGNKGLANRHLLISGKSGQGKTYFMQCLLLEKSKLGIPSIVIDYTEGFLPNQLEPEFVNYLGEKLKQKIVYSEKLPINPFLRNSRDIGGIELPESNTDVAERIKSVFAAVYKTLGIQQLNAIYEATLVGLEKYDHEMNLIRLKEQLEEEGSSYAKTALSQIRPLIDRNPFSTSDTINWKDIVESRGDVYIIQLTAFPRDVQLVITEFILWDLWNYSVRNGNKNKPMPVIMDEAQNLDHTEKSPSARILTEGRKFGWSAWYATQFLKSQLTADELARLQNASQKVYFSPPEQELTNIAASLSKDSHEKKQWENTLSSLKKGQCIVHGPIQKENGELSNPTVTVVNITPLAERI
jgi:DNA phosphorothioation-dependent restriction protein DptH